MDTLSIHFFAIFTKEDNFVTSCLLFCTRSPFKSRVYDNRKKICSTGASSLFSERLLVTWEVIIFLQSCLPCQCIYSIKSNLPYNFMTVVSPLLYHTNKYSQTLVMTRATMIVSWWTDNALDAGPAFVGLFLLERKKDRINGPNVSKVKLTTPKVS